MFACAGIEALLSIEASLSLKNLNYFEKDGKSDSFKLKKSNHTDNELSKSRSRT